MTVAAQRTRLLKPKGQETEGTRSLMKFAKYHALGNDYLVVSPADARIAQPAE